MGSTVFLRVPFLTTRSSNDAFAGPAYKLVDAMLVINCFSFDMSAVVLNTHGYMSLGTTRRHATLTASVLYSGVTGPSYLENSSMISFTRWYTVGLSNEESRKKV